MQEWRLTPERARQLHVSDGADPQASLIFDKSGALYGTTVAGGDNDFGTVF